MAGLGLVSLHDASRKVASREWLVDGVIERGSFFGLIGAAEAGKTFVAVDLAAGVASGTSWMGMNVARAGTVVYITAEASSSVVRRLGAWGHHTGQDIGSNVLIPSGSAVLTETSEQVFEELIEARPDLIIIDTWTRATPGMNENSADQVSEVIRSLDLVRHKTGAAVGVIHHISTSSGRARGSTALYGAFDTEFLVEQGDVPGEGSVCQTKVKDGTRDASSKMHFHITTGHVDEAGNPTGVLVPGRGQTERVVGVSFP